MMGSLSFGQKMKVDSTCVGTTLRGTNCKIKVNIDSTKYCRFHVSKELNNALIILQTLEAIICGEITNKRRPCRNKTRHSSGKCHHHRD